ncbi:MAG: hypothetical protein NTV70_18365 [Acidobacteria bacterium]|nr:hypothetical protein [Acidobacteriota bacterium]
MPANWRLRLAWLTLAAAIGASRLAAQPPLTTIQDTLYKADGSRFDGFAFVEWKSFDASNGSSVLTQSIVVRVAGGNLRVQLAPTTNVDGAYYLVKFNSDGRIQFTEYWSVAPSSGSLRLKDVRLASPPGSLTGGLTSSLTTVTIPEVTGLQTELDNRPVKGTPYTNGRTAVISSTGAIASASGNATDCVRVDGSTVACTPGGGPGFVDNEAPSGAVNGSNRVFTLASIPQPASSLTLYRNGVLQRNPNDFSVSGSTITFATAATPQTGDSILASYRLTVDPTPVGTAGGMLTGTYPNPGIAGNVVTNFNVSATAGITESKLSLNFPTHSNANDPTTAEKGAMLGTSGVPSATNKFVTDSDARLTTAGGGAGHGLLSTLHSDTTPGTVARGDVIVGTGATARWARLPLGAANRCLTSNGTDAVWNTCLYAGFPTGSIPYVDSTGNMANSSAALFWDPANRRISVGNNQSLSTAYFWDSNAAGSTTVAVRGGPAQGTNTLMRWLASDGTELANVSSAGVFQVKGLQTQTTSTQAAIRDFGSFVDPDVRFNGDLWYNTAQQTRKTMDAGQRHTMSQVVCNSTGANTTTSARLGSCFIPFSYLDAGDRIEVQFNYLHTGTTSDWNIGIAYGPGTLIATNVNKLERLVVGKSDVAIYGAGINWGTQSWGSGVYSFTVASNTAAALPTQAALIEFYGTILTPGTDRVELIGFTVIRHPANANPY